MAGGSGLGQTESEIPEGGNMVAIQQLKTSSCKTLYKVIHHGRPYKVRLWIIVGGTPALAFADNKGGTRRFEVSEVQAQKWQGWDGCYPHQNPDNPQGPTVADLPNGRDDLEQFVIDYAPHRSAQLKREAEYKWRKAHRLKPKEKWPTFEREPEPRQVKARQRPDGGFVVDPRDIVKALKRAKGMLLFGGCIMATTLLRQYASTMRGEWLLIVYPEDGQVRIVTADKKHASRIKHGAWDKYRGQNGYHAALEFATPD